ncbi:MAG: hypothetical protein EOR56_21075, partial [Mesorhizobium sp.]
MSHAASLAATAPKAVIRRFTWAALVAWNRGTGDVFPASSLPHFLTSSLPHFLTSLLPYCPTALLPYSPTPLL